MPGTPIFLINIYTKYLFQKIFHKTKKPFIHPSILLASKIYIFPSKIYTKDSSGRIIIKTKHF